MHEQLVASPERKSSAHIIHELGEDAVREVIEIPDSGFDIETANYKGNWSELALQRMASPDFRQKFIHWIEQTAAALPKAEGGGVSLAKGGSVDVEAYRSNINSFPDLHAAVSSHVTYAPSSEYGKKPSNRGKSLGIGEPAILFSDTEMSSRQKDIIVAHEMHHSLVDMQGTEPRSIITPAFDIDEIAKWNDAQRAQGTNKLAPLGYMSDPRELAARMAQLKNYYGMSGGEIFTKEHLKHAKVHYLADTELDNNMALFFRMIRDDKFIDLMNTLPI